MDFGTMHPDAWAKTDATRWNEYVQYRIAYEDGREEVKHRRGDPEKAAKNMKALIERATGKK